MKIAFLLLFLLASKLSFAQKEKKFFLFMDPVSILFRDPTIGFELSIKKSFFDAIQAEASYMLQDKRIGGFLKKGYDFEKSILTSFESFPMNRLPLYVYNGPSGRIGVLKYFYSKSIHQYLSFSFSARIWHYDSLHVNYTNTPREKRESLFDQTVYYEHFRNQSEKMNALGLGVEYGLRKSIDNMIINFFIRGNLFYASRNITSYNEQYNSCLHDKLNSSLVDGVAHFHTIHILQIRPQIGCRIGLTHF